MECAHIRVVIPYIIGSVWSAARACYVTASRHGRVTSPCASAQAPPCLQGPDGSDDGRSSRGHAGDRIAHETVSNVLRCLLCNAWIKACQRPDLEAKSASQMYNMHVCGRHFESWMYMKKKLKSSAIPTLNLPSGSIKSISTQTDVPKTVWDFCNRAVQTEERMILIQLLKQPTRVILERTHAALRDQSSASSVDPAKEKIEGSSKELQTPQQENSKPIVKMEFDIETEFDPKVNNVVQDIEQSCGSGTTSNSSYKSKKRKLIEAEPSQQSKETEPELTNIKAEEDHELPTSSGPLADDNYEVFGKYVASLLRRLTPLQATKVQPQIIDMIISQISNDAADD